MSTGADYLAAFACCDPMTDSPSSAHSGGEYIAWQAVGAAQTWIGWHNYSADYSIRRYLRVAYLLHGCLDSGLL